MKLTLRSSLLFVILLLSFGASSCLKTRSGLREETENPDSGYSNKVTEVSTTENQRVAEELRGEINQLNGRIDELQKKNEALAGDQAKKGERDNQMRDLESKIQEMQASQAAMIDALQKREKEKEKEKEIPKSDPATAYEKGRAAYREKRYDAAVDLLTQYLKFPKGKFTEEALYLRGESHYAKEQYKKAILDYSTLQEKFPKSKFISKGLLKIGMSFDALGMKSDAKAFYQEILDKHAKSPETKAAKAKLK
ncbi:MAG: tetratricopeptide repeat protein [Cryobacterium sp.]|nr:tetratricopeptide repeat protein [Oligoflexia bacterium]